MKLQLQRLLLTLSIGMLACNASYAQPGNGNGKSNGKNKNAAEQVHEHGNSNNSAATDSSRYFSDSQVQVISQYFTQNKSASACPPGLAKKNNGCRPPGQVKQWQRGQRLPDDVVYYDLPSALLRELGRTPEGQKVVRVGTDLLLIAVGTRMVIDAIEDLEDAF
jgi:Ni/Co efflux regulator RcnB